MSVNGVYWLALCIAVWRTVNADYEDLRSRPYCATRPDPQCCTSRDDDCSVPIADTKCYCDEFCDRGDRGDCCFDYNSHCRHIVEPDINRTCYYEGRYWQENEKWMDNCNTCSCVFMTDHMDVECTMHECLINDQLIAEVNRNERIRGWRAGRVEPFWSHRLSEGYEKKMGTLYARRPVLNMLPKLIPVVPGSLPPSFDARDQWPSYISPPQDQGWCANSWVWSTIGVASDRWSIGTRGAISGLLSGQHLFSCNWKNQRGCNGGFLTRAWNFIHKFGIVTDECLPWMGETPGRCGITKNTTIRFVKCPTNGKLEVLRRTGPLYRISGEEQMMKDIMTNGPVQSTMIVHKDLFIYKGGVYKCPEMSKSSTLMKPQHSVRIVGWGETTEFGRREKYWIASNSWGREWGENGYFRILRGNNECGIENFVLAMTIHSTPALDPLRFNINTTAF